MSAWCAVPECTQSDSEEKRHFFRFPKEHDRWLQWVKACGRLDLEPKGPKYAYENCRLCHLHFEEKWYKVYKTRALLHPDAIPTKFVGATSDKNNAAVSTMALPLEEANISTKEIEKEEEKIEEGAKNKTKEQEEINKNICADIKICGKTKKEMKKESLPVQKGSDNRDASSSSSDTNIQMSSDNSPQKRKLRAKIIKLKAQNKSLRETIRRLRKEKQKTRTKNASVKEEDNEHQTLRQLGCADRELRYCIYCDTAKRREHTSPGTLG